VCGVLTTCWLETWLLLIGVIWANGPCSGGINAGHPGAVGASLSVRET